MPFTLVIYSQSQAANGYTFFKPLVDQSQSPTGNGITTPVGYNKLFAGYVQGASAVRGRISSPSLRKWANFYVAPADNAANPSANPPIQIIDYETTLPITEGDELDFEIDNGNTSERDFGFAWLAAPPLQEITAKIFTVEATGSTTLTANAWSLVPLTFTTSLEAGLYQIVGLYAHFGGAIAARFVFTGALAAVRPGVIASSTANKNMPLVFRYGLLGLWGVFHSASPPQIECLGTTATASQRFFIDLIKGPTGIGQVQANPQSFGAVFSGAT